MKRKELILISLVKKSGDKSRPISGERLSSKKFLSRYAAATRHPIEGDKFYPLTGKRVTTQNAKQKIIISWFTCRRNIA